jgi:hypothetical protein
MGWASSRRAVWLVRFQLPHNAACARASASAGCRSRSTTLRKRNFEMTTAFSHTLSATLLIAAAAMSGPAIAGPFTDELSKCLVSKTTAEDKTTLMTWVFAAIALNPNVSQFAAISPQQRDQIDANMARMFENLMTQTCKTEAQAAVQYEGNSAIEAGFNVLGQVAGRELFANPEVAKGMAGLQSHIDSKKLESVFGTAK